MEFTSMQLTYRKAPFGWHFNLDDLMPPTFIWFDWMCDYLDVFEQVCRGLKLELQTYEDR